MPRCVLALGRRAVALLALVAATANAAPDLGHKVMGTLGLDAGTQPPTGIYVADTLLFYSSDAIYDRNGRRLPTSVALTAVTNELGVAGTYELPRLHTYVSAAVALPIANVTGTSDDVRGSLDRFGLADAYVQPLRLGWRTTHVEAQTGYAFYVPTGHFEAGGVGGVSRGSWSHEVSVGGALYFDRSRSWKLTALASLEINAPKIGFDLTRGSTIQVQGGAGKSLTRRLEAGLVGYGLWQVSDDGGGALPAVLRGARDRVYGLGGEVDVDVAEARARVTLRYTHDFGAASRPQGQVLLMTLAFTPWTPR